MVNQLPQLIPFDEHNRHLESNVHPPDWKNPSPASNYHLIIIGAGTAGLVTAAAAAGLGARVALIERELMGGDCLNVGCVPSKSLIAAARLAAIGQRAKKMGFANAGNPDIDFSEVMERMRRQRSQISPVDSAKRFADLGVDVFFGQGSFVDDQTISIQSTSESPTQLKFKKAVIASGARAKIPEIPGLDQVDFLTNETLFSLTELPPRFGVIGGGPIGCEIAQCFARFGSRVSLFERGPNILSREEPDAARVLQDQFEKEKISLFLKSNNLTLEKTENGILVRGLKNDNATPFETTVDQLLIAVGRTPNLENLNLESAKVKYNDQGIVVNDSMQTSNPKIFAAGDICSKYKFTHAADFQARIVIQNALFAIGPIGRKKASQLLIPRATYTSPEIAHVGLYPQEAQEQSIKIDTFTQSFEHLDRAILESTQEGFVKVHTRKGTDQIVGATIVADHAGDLISEVTIAITSKIGLSKIGATIHPYPTYADAIRKLGDQYNKTKLTPMNQKILNWLLRINVGR